MRYGVWRWVVAVFGDGRSVAEVAIGIHAPETAIGGSREALFGVWYKGETTCLCGKSMIGSTHVY